jgi:LysM repeat protein
VSRPPERHRRLAHYGAPVLLLAVVTVAVLLIRSGLEAGSTTTATSPGVTQATTPTVATRRRHARPKVAAGYYTVQTGDTFSSISARTGVSIVDLERLNPGISSNALQVGQKLRVK